MSHKGKRKAILDAVYLVQEASPKGSGLGIQTLKKQMGFDIDFDMEYLKEKGLLKAVGAYLKLTVAGIDEVESDG